MSRSDPCNKKPVIKYIKKYIKKKKPEELIILDLAIGEGDFGFLIKKKIKIITEITGVEIWRKYRTKKWNFYDSLFLGDIRDFLKNQKKKFDIVLLIDIIEHFNEKEGEQILRKVFELTKKVILLSTPITEYPQADYNGNPFERHIFFWDHEKLSSFGFKQIYKKKVKTFATNPKKAILGIYAYEND